MEGTRPLTGRCRFAGGIKVEAEMFEAEEADADAFIVELVAQQLHNGRPAANRDLQGMADDMGVSVELDIQQFSDIFPLFAYDGTPLDGPAEVMAAIQARSPAMGDDAASDHAHRSYQYSQALEAIPLGQQANIDLLY